MKRIGIGLVIVCAAVCIAVGLAGCASKADENKPMTDVQAEAQKMNAEQLRAAAMKYRDAIMAKQADVEKVMAKLKAIPPAEIMGKEATQVRQDVDNISKSIKALKERLDVYYNKLEEMGGDVSGLSI
jgi:outer membrane murein-binding lipoprotein Lpp